MGRTTNKQEDAHERHHEMMDDPVDDKMHPSHRDKPTADQHVEHVNNKGMSERHAGVGSMGTAIDDEADAEGQDKDRPDRSDTAHEN